MILSKSDVRHHALPLWLAPAAVLLASSEDSGVDAGRLLKEMLQQAGGRGGGNPRLAQGSIPDPGRLPSLLEALAAAIAEQPRY